MRLFLLALLFAFGLPEASHGATVSGSLPPGLPNTLQLGLADPPNNAHNLRQSVPVGYRYQYLSDGVNTGKGWQTWSEGNFVDYYVQDSVDNQTVPFFSYYMLRQSYPGRNMEEVAGVHANLQNKTTMNAFYNDLKVFFQKAGQHEHTIVLQVEPDMWGYIHKQQTDNNATNYLMPVASTGNLETINYPNNAVGMAQVIKSMRDKYAPNVLLAYPISIWGTNVDISIANPTEEEIDSLGHAAAIYYKSLSTNFDIATAEFSDRDSAYKQIIDKQGKEAWWDAKDFANHARFLYQFTTQTNKRIILWQIPLGNTKMLAMNNTWGHYQDNRVEWLLDDPTGEHIKAYLNAGVVAMLFGGGVPGSTCACDAVFDGIINPLPLNANSAFSFSIDDDGGFFKQKANLYYQMGARPLPKAKNYVPPKTTGFIIKTNSAKKVYKRNAKAVFTTRVTSGQFKKVIVDIQFYNSRGKRVWQKYYKNQFFTANKARIYRSTFIVPKTLPKGSYTVKVGVFTPGWKKLVKWNDRTFIFVVK